MSLIDQLSAAHAELESRRDVNAALHAFLVASKAAKVMESAGPPEQFTTWVLAGDAAFEGASALGPVSASPYEMSGADEEVGAAIDEVSERSTVTKSVAALGALLREVLVDAAHQLDDPDIRLAALTASRHGTRLQFLLDE